MYTCLLCMYTCILSTCTSGCVCVCVAAHERPRSRVFAKSAWVEKIFRLIYMRRFACTRARITPACLLIYIYMYIYINLSAINTRDMPHRDSRFNFFNLRMCRTRLCRYLSLSLTPFLSYSFFLSFSLLFLTFSDLFLFFFSLSLSFARFTRTVTRM